MRVEWKNEDGASAVEFALVLPILILVVFAIIEFSVALYDKAMITNASREGARAGIVAQYDPTTGTRLSPNPILITNTVQNYCNNYLVTFSGPTTAQVIFPPAPPNQLSVMVTYNYTLLVGSVIPLSATTVMNLE
jgi:Flp pilus assembly protein TadG